MSGSVTTVSQLLQVRKAGMACVPPPSVLIKTVICNQVIHSVEFAPRGRRRKLTQGQLSFFFCSQRVMRSQIDWWEFNPALVAGGIRGGGNACGIKSVCVLIIDGTR